MRPDGIQWGPIVAAIIIAAVAILAVFLGATIYSRYLRISRSKAVLLFFFATIAGVGLGIYRFSLFERDFGRDFQAFFNGLSVALAGLLPVVAVPFSIRLYLKWIGGQLTEADKAPGMDGLRAWLRGGNAMCILLIPLCAWAGWGYSFFAVLALTLMAVLAYPILNLAAASFQAPTPSKSDNLSPEREKVLKMLEDGKITAEESAELLNALGQSVPPRAPQTTAASPHRKMVLAGLGLLLIGFFLPWFSYNPGEEVSRMMGEAQQQVAQAMPQNFNLHIDLPMNLKTGSVHIAGGEIKYGLGWWVLLLGIAAAVLPYVASNLDPQTQQKAILIGLTVGGIILIYLLTQSMRYVSIGIILGLAGYALQLVGTLKERQGVSS